MYVEARRAGREGEFYVFHLGWPEISARYNAVGRFGRISEVATRIAGQLSGEGNSAAFREFAWRFVNIIARALVARPRVIVADEPTGALDTATTKEIMTLFQTLGTTGITIVLVTHEHDVAAYASRLIVMKDGKVETDTRQAAHA